MRHQFIGHARSIVPDAEFERQRNARIRPWQRQANSRSKRSRQRDFAAICGLADGFRGVLDQIKEYLNEMIAIGEDRWQGWVIILDKLDVSREAGLRQALHMV